MTKTPAFLALCILWVVVLSFHMSYGPEGKKIVFEEEGGGCWICLQRQMRQLRKSCLPCVQGVDPSQSLSEFNVSENRVLLEVSGDGGH